MDKTLHKKLIEKNHSSYMHLQAFPAEEALLYGHAHEMRILAAAAKDLMQPRPEAIARLLQLAKNI
ncbi:MAG: hypothetical protein JWQ38_3140 [Flavipsychrobacter sp.]|nr:hypothetical protein [Flavipsychrobacter sp.]